MIKKTKTFQIDYKSDMDDQEYSGQFTCRKMTVADVSKINIRKSQLCGGMYCVKDEDGKPTGQGIDEDTDFFNYMIAMLEAQLVQKPAWWKLDEIIDQGLVTAVFKEVSAFESSFRRRGDGGNTPDEGAAEGSAKDSASKSTESSINDSHPKKVVGSEVQSALDA